MDTATPTPTTLDTAAAAFSLSTLPLSALRFGHQFPGGSVNVRKPSGLDAQRMAASIEREGLLQPLLVVPGPTLDGTFFTVIGGRRLAGLNLLAARGTLSPDAPVAVTIAPDLGTAELLAKSLAAEESHLPPHPVDRYDAFAALKRLGISDPDIAARHFLELRTVRQCLALGELHEEIRNVWRQGLIGADVAAVFTLADDKAHQIKVLDKLRGKFGGALGMLTPEAVRKHFAGSEAEARRLLLYVGAEPYTAAGGRLIEDLFSGTDAAPAHIVQDLAKLKKLAQAKLDAEADGLMNDGWAWAESSLAIDPAPGAVSRIVIENPKLDQAEIEAVRAIKKKIKQLDKEALADKIADNDIERIAAEREQLEHEQARIEHAAALRSYKPEQKAKAGCIVSIAADGTACIDHGIVRPQAKPPEPEPEPAAGRPAPERLSQASREALGRVRTKAIALTLATNQRAALAAILASAGATQAPIEIFMGKSHGRTFRAAFQDFFALDHHELVAHIAALAQSALALEHSDVKDIAALIAVNESAYAKHAAEAFEAKAFLAGCSKDYLLDVIGEALGADERRRQEDATQKSLAAFALDSVAAKKGWLPPELRGPTNGKKGKP